MRPCRRRRNRDENASKVTALADRRSENRVLCHRTACSSGGMPSVAVSLENSTIVVVDGGLTYSTQGKAANTQRKVICGVRPVLHVGS